MALVSTLKPTQNGCNLADDVFGVIVWTLLYFVLVLLGLFRGPINKLPVVVQMMQMMAWRHLGNAIAGTNDGHTHTHTQHTHTHTHTHIYMYIYIYLASCKSLLLNLNSQNLRYITQWTRLPRGYVTYTDIFNIEGVISFYILI